MIVFYAIDKKLVKKKYASQRMNESEWNRKKTESFKDRPVLTKKVCTKFSFELLHNIHLFFYQIITIIADNCLKSDEIFNIESKLL